MKRLLLIAGLILLAVSITLIVVFYHVYQPWVAVHTGTATGQESGGAYAYWSGFGSVFPWEFGALVTVLVWMITHYRLNNCHIERCPRIGRFSVAGDHFKVCRKHHPEAHVRNKRISFDHIQHMHALHLLKTGMIKFPDEHKDTK
jgi:hypothetical protein